MLSLWQSLFQNRLAYFDGGMGTLLQAQGLSGGQRPERWNLEHPDRILEIHRAYLNAGAEVITANTFGATAAHLGRDAAACMTAGVRLAKEAVTTAGRGYAAIDMGSLGRLLKPLGDLPFEEAVARFRDSFEAGVAAGGDLILIETMTDLLEAKACVLAAREAMERAGRRLPLFVSLTFDQRGRLLSGADIPGAVAMLAGLRVDAVGLNCGHEPKALVKNAKALLDCCPLPVFICPNASLPLVREGKTFYPTSPEEFAGDMALFAQWGAWGLGGCCGTTPEHIAALVDATKNMNTVPRSLPGQCILSGSAKSVVIGRGPVLIGERLNPTGKKRLKQALLENDMDYLMGEAVAQTEAGADLLDVNVGLPELDEPKALTEAMLAIQTVCDLPLQADSANPAALEAALRGYCGRPAINSVCGKQAVMNAVFPIAAKYGAALVALTLDDDGIPETAEGRVAVAEKILAEAAKYGIGKDELLFDGLTLTAATDPMAARVTLETVRLLKARLNVRTVLGVSNISFGLPQRPLLTAAFLAMAIANGLDAAIMNPSDPTAKAVFDAARALSGCGVDDFLARYGQGMGQYRVTVAAPVPDMGAALSPAMPERFSPKAEGQEPGDDPLFQAIRLGLANDAAAAAEALLNAGDAPLSIIEKSMMPALSLVGEAYEQGRLFLPQLLRSASAAQAAFEAVRQRIPDQGAPNPARKVVLATVKGDVHDIGKNIVKVLLQNYGFSVVDLGRDVAPEAVLEAARNHGVGMVGLSALMTTTVPAMEETILLLHRELKGVRVVVGGAVLTEDYARRIGADGYGKDAMATVRLCEKWCIM